MVLPKQLKCDVWVSVLWTWSVITRSNCGKSSASFKKFPFCLFSQCHILHCQRLYNSYQLCQHRPPPTALRQRGPALVWLWMYFVLIEMPILSVTLKFSGVPDYFHGCSKQHFHFSYQTVLLLLSLSLCTKVLLKYWWCQLLPSSLLENRVSGVTWDGPDPLLTNSVLILSVRCEGQPAGSVGSGATVFAATLTLNTQTHTDTHTYCIYIYMLHYTLLLSGNNLYI